MEKETDYKKQAAAEALKLILPGQRIGLGNGASVAHLARMLTEDKKLAATTILTSSAASTTLLLEELGLNVRLPGSLSGIDIYFDGCDQFDARLNALKSGGGIHTTEKILASIAKKFILVGDITKMVESFDVKDPLVLEILPPALGPVKDRLAALFSNVIMTLREKEGQPILSEYGNYLLDLKFAAFPELEFINSTIKMIPGIVDHSLFYKMACAAIIAGPDGVRTIFPSSDPGKIFFK